MPKPLFAEWHLQAIANAEVARLAPECRIIPCVQPETDQIVWDDQCKGVGRATWYCGYILPPDDPSARALVPTLDATRAKWQERYDLDTPAMVRLVVTLAGLARVAS